MLGIAISACILLSLKENLAVFQMSTPQQEDQYACMKHVGPGCERCTWSEGSRIRAVKSTWSKRAVPVACELEEAPEGFLDISDTRLVGRPLCYLAGVTFGEVLQQLSRSEERRVGKECRP